MNGSTLKIGITCYPSIGGSGVIATTLGMELAKRGHEVHFISYDRPFRLPENEPNIHFHPVTVNDYGLFKYPDYTLPLSVKMAEVSKEYKLDILHVHYAVPHATAAALAHSMLPIKIRPKLVTTLHGTDTTLLGNDPGYGPAIHYALVQSDAVNAVSDWLKEETRRVLHFDCPIDVIHNFFDPAEPSKNRNEFRKELGIREDEVVIFHSSNLRPLKRIDILLEAVSRIKNKDAFKLLVLAGGSFEPFAEEVARLGLTENLIVRENVQQIEDYLNIADIGLITSESESFCMSVLEAMFFGVPSVATDVGGIPEVIEDGISGLLVPSGDVQATTLALEKLIADKDMRTRLGQAAAQRARNKFTADAIIPRYMDLYRTVQRKSECASVHAQI